MTGASLANADLNSVDEYILALLNAQGARPLPGKLHLQKEMYLLQRAFPDLRVELDFEPYFLGPHSAIVEDEADQLARSDLIRGTDGPIVLTPSGRRRASLIAASLPAERRAKIEEFKALLNDLSDDELLVFVYFGYPDLEVGEESAVYKRLEKMRETIAHRLYSKHKVSAERGAEIAGEPLEEFIAHIEGRHE